MPQPAVGETGPRWSALSPTRAQDVGNTPNQRLGDKPLHLGSELPQVLKQRLGTRSRELRIVDREIEIAHGNTGAEI